MSNLKISALTAGTAPTGAELVPSVQGGNTRSLTSAQIAGLASNITGTDYNIGTGNETADISVLTATVGSSARYSWYGGDSTNNYTFSFTGTTGITIDGIASSEYIGEGVGHLDLFVVSASACVTINRGEIWDNDGGNFGAGTTWNKRLSGVIKYFDWDYLQGDNSTSMNTDEVLKIIPAIIDNLCSWSLGAVATASGAPSAITDLTVNTTFTMANAIIKDADELTIYYTRTTNFLSTSYYAFGFGYDGRWTESYPRIT